MEAKPKIVIIGHARHGKDTLAKALFILYNLSFKGSSEAASEIFIYDRLKDQYGYKSPAECFEDRVNHRKEWYDLIVQYNKHDKARLAKEIMAESDIYVGMRSNEEIKECLAQGVFNLVIGVYNPRVPLESPDSFNIDLWGQSDFVIPNAGKPVDLIGKAKTLILCDSFSRLHCF